MEEKGHIRRRLRIRLHDGGSIAIQADAPESAIAFDGFGELLCWKPETGQDEIATLSPAQFFAQCYRSMFYWNLFYAINLPEEKQRFLANRIRTQTEIIAGMFPPRALLTVPEGSGLAELIEEKL